MKQRSDSVTGVIRPTWSGNAEQLRLLDAAIRAAKEADEKVEQAWLVLKAARDADVPDTVICDSTGWSRSTFNRKFGPRHPRRT